MAKVNTAVKAKNINLNKVNVTGRLVADPQTLITKNNRFLHKLRIAINKVYKSNEFTSFIDIEIFTQEEILLKKGQQVYIDGRVASDEWEKDGTLRSKVKIQAFNIIPTKMSGNDINNIMMSGRLVKDPTVVKVKEGRSAIKFRLAVNRNYQKDKEWKQVTEFIDVVQFGTTDYIAKLASKISKGKFVYIQGFLKQESWETQAGEKRSKIVVVAEQINYALISNTKEKAEEKAKEKADIKKTKKKSAQKTKTKKQSKVEEVEENELEELEALEDLEDLETPF